MTKRDPHDPTLMLVIFALAVLFAIWRAISSIDPSALLDGALSSAASLAPFALGAIAIASALAPQRFLATRRALRRRTAAAVVPADEFEADLETVLRVGAELSRADLGLRGWFDRPARALRVGLVNDRQGRRVYLLQFPQRSEELVRTALRSYEGVELRDAADVLPGWPQVERVKLRTELVLAHPSVDPLRRLELAPNPLQPFAAPMASLEPERGERAWVCPSEGWLTKQRAERLHSVDLSMLA